MKWVHVNQWQRALVFKRGVYQRMLMPGKYWFWGTENVQVCDLTQPFYAPVELNILLQDAELKAALHVVEVKDGEVVLQYENGLLKQVLPAGRYTFWKGVIDYMFVWADTNKTDITEPIDRSVLQHQLMLPYVRNITIDNHERAALFIDGRFVKILESGVYYWYKNSIAINVVRADMRQQQAEINGQEILTRDKAALRINAWAQYKVVDVEQAVLYNKEYDKQLYILLQLGLREYISGLSFDELLDKKDSIGAFVLEKVKAPVAALGVEVMGFGIRDIVLPGDVKEIMNQVLVAEKKAQANVIMRREETASTRSLLNTAKLMDENAMLWKLKEMEYVEKIAEKVSNISVHGNGMLVEQLKQLFVPQK